MCARLGFTQIHPAHISAYERELREPPLPVILKYARLAGISPDVLIDDKQAWVGGTLNRVKGLRSM